MLWVIIQSIINGILMGGVYALIGVGITIIFGVMKMVNFAAGSYLVWGMYFTYLFHLITGWNCYLLIPFVIVAMAIFGYITFQLSIRRVLDVGGTSFILITVGLSYFLQNLAEMLFGTTPKTVPSAINTTSIMLGRYSIGLPRFIAFCAMLVLVLLVNALLTKTNLGRAMRATSEKPEVAKMIGINTDRTYTIAFIIGVVFAGLAGLFLTPLYYVTPTVGSIFRTSALMVCVMGGLGNIKGALVAGIIVGIVESLIGTVVSADLGMVAVCVLFLITLYVKPQGILGKGERKA